MRREAADPWPDATASRRVVLWVTCAAVGFGAAFLSGVFLIEIGPRCAAGGGLAGAAFAVTVVAGLWTAGWTGRTGSRGDDGVFRWDPPRRTSGGGRLGGGDGGLGGDGGGSGE
ncbi:hypothetical protein [Streptomyces sp. NPDC047886]|uniref:hypothetical protein n=1 Tax=Streptomyces sp. NPDC047886 TaxID=3365490 RepID=UPI00371AA614